MGDGPVDLEYEGGTEPLGRAESCLLPAAIGELRVVPSEPASFSRPASLLASYVPDLERDVAGPLREAGYPDEEIRALGEIPGDA